MKRFLILALVLCFVCSAALAEEQQPKSVWDSIGGWVSQAAEDASARASQAWRGGSAWLEGAWGDASEWVGRAWRDSPAWAKEIWGDVSAWAGDAYGAASGSIGAWWTETFSKVTGSEDGAWGWISEEAAALSGELRGGLSAIRDAVSAGEAEAVRAVFDGLLAELGVTDGDAGKVWDTVGAYAEEKGISRLTAAKLALPYLFRLTADSGNSDEDIPAIAIAQYVTAIVEKLNLSSEQDAAELVRQLSETLEGIR